MANNNSNNNNNTATNDKSVDAFVSSSAALREDLIEKAIGFLTHPKVADTPLSRKKDFLREKKGMTEAEINEAVKRAGASDDQRPKPGNTQTYNPPPPPPPPQQGVSAVGALAGGVALVAAAVAGYYGFQHWNVSAKEEKKQKKKKKQLTESGSKVATTPVKSTASSKRTKSKPSQTSDDEEMQEVKDIQAGFQSALQSQADQYAKRMQEGEEKEKERSTNVFGSHLFFFFLQLRNC